MSAIVVASNPRSANRLHRRLVNRLARLLLLAFPQPGRVISRGNVAICVPATLQRLQNCSRVWFPADNANDSPPLPGASSMSTFLCRLGTSAARHWRRTVLVAIVVIAAHRNARQLARRRLRRRLPHAGRRLRRVPRSCSSSASRRSPGGDAQIVFAGDPCGVTGYGVKATLKAVEGQPHVTGVSDAAGRADGKVAFATVQYDVPAEELGPEARERLESVDRAGRAGRRRGLDARHGDRHRRRAVGADRRADRRGGRDPAADAAVPLGGGDDADARGQRASG